VAGDPGENLRGTRRVIAVDTNILVYAHREDSPWHRAAYARLRELAEGSAPWAIPWPCVHEFLAVVSHPNIYRPPTPLAHALDQVGCWLESPSLHPIGELEGYWETLKAVMLSGNIAGAKTHDARVVAICRQHGVKVVWSADRDLSRFGGLKIVNPLISEGGG
jgi:hypothetical protein